MLSANYNLKVIDFGDAKNVNEPSEEEKDDNNKPKPALMRRGTFVGTMNYQSPEMINEDL